MRERLLHRRHALRVAAGSLAGLLGGGLFACRRAGDEALEAPVAAIVAEVERALPQLRLERAGVVAFARELVRQRDAGRLRPLPGLDLRSRFLLSSDLFRRTGEDSDRPVRYAAFYDPYVTPCANPLPRRGGRK